MLFQTDDDEIEEYFKLLNLIEALIFQTKISEDSIFKQSQHLMKQENLPVEWKVNLIKLIGDTDIPLSFIKKLILLLDEEISDNELFSIYYTIRDQKK